MTSPTTKKYRIIIADDHAIVREGLKNLIDGQGNLRVVAEAENGEELLRHLSKRKVELLICDLSMPKLNGLEAISEIKQRYPSVKILVLTMHKEREFFRKTLTKGVEGYLLKDDMLEDVLAAVFEVQKGKKVYSKELTSYIVDDYQILYDSQLSQDLLTRREKDVLREIASGKMNKEIAEALKIGVRTVETHRANIMEKLDIRNVAGLTKYALSQGLI